MAVLQTVFPDAAYDVLNDAYYSNYDARAVTVPLLIGMTVSVQFLIQGLFVAGVTPSNFLPTPSNFLPTPSHSQPS